MVEIDGNSGFCGGVIRAITTAENFLKEHGGRMYSLGAIVHNEKELARLEAEGLIPLDKGDLENIVGAEGETLLVRAHGEPPQIYDKVRSKGFTVVDCTCPVVLKLQKSIRDAYSRISERGGQVLIYGKIGHPEVLGLVGQVDGKALVFENEEQMDALMQAGHIDTGHDIELFSQTTKDPAEYGRLAGILRSRMCGGASLNVNMTICSQVAGRHRELSEFAVNHDVIVFVSGRHSSNGKVLSDLCRSCNPRTYSVSSAEEIRREWFGKDDFVGVSGATSTPKWLLEEVARTIENLQ